MPTCWIFASPNGAGKTTFAKECLPNELKGLRFANADSIAAGLSPLVPEEGIAQASKLYLQQVNKFIDLKQDFAIETTLSGRSYLKLTKHLKRRLGG